MWLSPFFNMMRLTILNKNLITLNIKQTKKAPHISQRIVLIKNHIIVHDNNNGYKIRLYKLYSEFY